MKYFAKSLFIILIACSSKVFGQITGTVSSYTTCIENNFPKYSQPITVTLTGASNYVWFPYNIPVQGSGSNFTIRMPQSTCFTVVGQTSSGTISAQFCFTVIPQFTLDVFGDPTYCQPYPATLAVNNIGGGPNTAPYTYSWTESPAAFGSLDSPLSKTVHASPQAPTIYSVEVRDANQCVSVPKTVAVSLSNCTSIQELQLEKQFQIFPNPSSGTIFLNVEYTGNTDIAIFNSSGELQFKHETNGPVKIDLNDLPSGIYFAIIKTDSANVTRKIVVQ